MDTTAVTLVLGTVFLWGVVSARAQRAHLSAPMVFVTAGFVLTETLGILDLQVEHEAGPGLVADRGPRRRTGELRHQRDGIVGLLPRDNLEHVGLRHDSRRFESRHDEVRISGPREHEHRQPLERHRLVAGEVRQVAAHRQQQHVDALVGHRLAHPVEAVEVDAHGDSLPPAGSAETWSR